MVNGGFAFNNSPGVNGIGNIQITNISVSSLSGVTGDYTIKLELSADGFNIPDSTPLILSCSVAVTSTPQTGAISYQSFVGTNPNNGLFATTGSGVLHTNHKWSAICG